MTESQFWGGTFRKLWPSETSKFRDHLLRLDAENRRLRFGMPVKDDFIRDYAGRIADYNSLVHGYFEKGQIRAAAELRQIGDAWSAKAEAAFSVEPGYQNKGIGTELLGRIVRSARNRGITRLYMNCLLENRKMQRIAKKYDAVLQFDHGDVVGRVVPGVPTYVSLWSEALEDGNGFMMAVLDLPKMAMPAA
jgi:GNAT superfamily N-acetyltransferase